MSILAVKPLNSIKPDRFVIRHYCYSLVHLFPYFFAQWTAAPRQLQILRYFRGVLKTIQKRQIDLTHLLLIFLLDFFLYALLLDCIV